MTERVEPSTQDMLEHLGWVRSLARSLVADVHLAEDVAQDAWAAALQASPRDPSRWRSWMRSVIRNRILERSRSQAAMRAREELVARREALPGPDDVVQKVELSRRLAAHVLALDEPYRTAVILRFHEELMPAEIARRTRAPVETVKSRIRRGIEQLRERLDREHGEDRGAWALLLLPLASSSKSAAWPWIGGVVMSAKLVVVVSLVAGASLYFFWPKSSLPEPIAMGSTAALASEARPHPSATADLATEPRVVGATTRSSATDTSVPATVSVPPAVAANRATARVVDAEGVALPGHDVRIRGTDQVAKSTIDGQVEIALASDRCELESADPLFVTVRAASWRRGAVLEPLIVVARAIQLEGVVADEWGAPLAGAEVVHALPEDFSKRFSHALDASSRAVFSTRSDERGRFVLTNAPSITDTMLRASIEGHATGAITAPLSDAHGLRIELGTPEIPSERRLAGRVLRASGVLASEARVGLGNAVARTDSNGAFQLDLARASGAERLVAVEAGSLPGIVERSAATDPRRSGWPDFVEVRLGNPALTIRGRVIDSNGKAGADLRVWIGDPTTFGVLGTIPLRLEGLMVGAEIPSEAIESLTIAQDPNSPQEFGSAQPARSPNALFHWVVTDSEGRFELGGLDDRRYDLCVADPKLHFGLKTERIAAGRRDVEIQIPPREAIAYPRLRGRVVTKKGTPVADVDISTFLQVVSAKERVYGGTVDVSRFLMGERTRSAADGSYELVDVPRALVAFELGSNRISPLYASVEDVTDPDHHDFVVVARARIDVGLSRGPEFADAIALEDETGKRLPIYEMRSDGYSNFQSYPLTKGRSGVVTVDSDAATLMLLRGDVEVQRIPIVLTLDRITTVSL